MLTVTKVMRVLLVEDDPVLGETIQQGLREDGQTCQLERNGLAAIQVAQLERFDVIVLDVMLPGTSGFEVLNQLRNAGNQTPIVMVTALGTLEDRVRGLNGGADDYIVKPFEFPELLARLKAVCRRASQGSGTTLSVGNLKLDIVTRRVSRELVNLDLTPTEFSLLEFLMRHSGEIVTRKMLCEHLWDDSWEGVTNVIEVHINRLRGKVDRGFEQPLIQTIRGRGYMLKG